MKKLIPVLTLFFTLSASAATLEGFFGKLEGKWEMVWSQTTPVTITRFSAEVTRTGNTWNFIENVCTHESQGDVCGTNTLSYEVVADSLFVKIGDENALVDVKELTDDSMMIMFDTKDMVFTAVINRSANMLFQDALIEYADGTQEQLSLQLEKR